MTLQPFEYCLPFADVEDLKDTKDIVAWHKFVEDTCGVKLTVRAFRETDSQS